MKIKMTLDLDVPDEYVKDDEAIDVPFYLRQFLFDHIQNDLIVANLNILSTDYISDESKKYRNDILTMIKAATFTFTIG